MLDFIYHMTFELLKSRFFWRENCHLSRNVIIDVIT